MSDAQPPTGPPNGSGNSNDADKPLTSTTDPTPSTSDGVKKEDVEMKESEEEPLPDEILKASAEE